MKHRGPDQSGSINRDAAPTAPVYSSAFPRAIVVSNPTVAVSNPVQAPDELTAPPPYTDYHAPPTHSSAEPVAKPAYSSRPLDWDAEHVYPRAAARVIAPPPMHPMASDSTQHAAPPQYHDSMAALHHYDRSNMMYGASHEAAPVAPRPPRACWIQADAPDRPASAVTFFDLYTFVKVPSNNHDSRRDPGAFLMLERGRHTDTYEAVRQRDPMRRGIAVRRIHFDATVPTKTVNETWLCEATIPLELRTQMHAAAPGAAALITVYDAFRRDEADGSVTMYIVHEKPPFTRPCLVPGDGIEPPLLSRFPEFTLTRTLKDAVQDGSLTHAAAYYIMLQLLSVCEYLHGQLLIHGDIALETVLIWKEGEVEGYPPSSLRMPLVKLADYGFLSLLYPNRDRKVAVEDTPSDKRDIFLVGYVFYCMFQPGFMAERAPVKRRRMDVDPSVRSGPEDDFADDVFYSPDGKITAEGHLLHAMTQKEPKLRPSASTILRDCFDIWLSVPQPRPISLETQMMPETHEVME